MNRLPLELDRLYGLSTGLGHGTRAAVLSLVLPAGWEQLALVWRGVQADLELPAPAIALSGIDALQLWFSFAVPTSSSAAARFLQGLCERYLPGIKPAQVRLYSAAAELPLAPCAETSAEHWSAFVTHDLAAVFAETPWLDTPPTDEGQATILRGLQPIKQGAFEAALKGLAAIETALPVAPRGSERAGALAAEVAHPGDSDPARFLAGVMNDETAPLALRIEAARILLADAKRPCAGLSPSR